MEKMNLRTYEIHKNAWLEAIHVKFVVNTVQLMHGMFAPPVNFNVDHCAKAVKNLMNYAHLSLILMLSRWWSLGPRAKTI